MEMAYRLEEAEGALAGMETPDVPYDIVELDRGTAIALNGWEVYVPGLGVSLQEGILCRYDEEGDGYLPDFPVTVVKEDGQEGWICYGTGGFLDTLAEYLQGRMEWGQLEQLRCLIHMPGEEASLEEEIYRMPLQGGSTE